MKFNKNNKLLMASVSLVCTLLLTLCLFSMTKTEAKAGGLFDYFDRISMSKCNITLNQKSYDWTGSPIIPDVTVSYNGTTLVEGTDYTLVCSQNVNAGEARVKIKGINNYRGSETYRFDINGIDLSNGGTAQKNDCTCTKLYINEDEYKYAKNDICYELDVYYNGELLKTTDYKVSATVQDTPLYKIGTSQIYSRRVTYKVTGTGKYFGSFRFRNAYDIKVMNITE